MVKDFVKSVKGTDFPKYFDSGITQEAFNKWMEENMVYLTGDTHNEFTRLSNKYFKKYDLEIGENDYIIVCGDLGLCWSKDKTFEWNCKWFAEKPYTLLWVQGNHENYDMIDEYPIEKWHGGKVRHIVRDKVILLERGQIFDIEGKTFS